MQPDLGSALTSWTFRSPLPYPVQDPDGTPSKSITVACSWLPYIRGALLALVLQYTWQQTDASSVLLAQQQAMTLIAMFTECEGENIPIACDYDFREGDEHGWAPIVTGGVTYAVFTSGHWEPGCLWCNGVDRNQMQVFKDTPTDTYIYSVTIRYNSFVDLDLYLSPDNVTTIGPVHCPANNDALATIVVNSPATTARIIINGPLEEHAVFQLLETIIVLANPDGHCA